MSEIFFARCKNEFWIAWVTSFVLSPPCLFILMSTFKIHKSDYLKIWHMAVQSDLFRTPDSKAFCLVLRTVPLFSTGDLRLMLELQSFDSWNLGLCSTVSSLVKALNIMLSHSPWCWGMRGWCWDGSGCRRVQSGWSSWSALSSGGGCRGGRGGWGGTPRTPSQSPPQRWGSDAGTRKFCYSPSPVCICYIVAAKNTAL